MDSKKLSACISTYLAFGGFLLLMAFLNSDIAVSPLLYFFLIIPLVLCSRYFHRKGFSNALIINALISLNAITIYFSFDKTGTGDTVWYNSFQCLAKKEIWLEKPGLLTIYIIFFAVGYITYRVAVEAEENRLSSNSKASSERLLKSEMQKLEDVNKQIAGQIKVLSDDAKNARVKLTVRIENLKNITTSIVKSLNTPEVITQVLNACKSLLAADKAAVFLEAKNANALELGDCFGYEPGRIKFIDKNQGMVKWVIENKKMVTTDDIRRNYQLADLLKADKFPMTVCSPLFFGKDKVGGILAFERVKAVSEEPQAEKKKELKKGDSGPEPELSEDDLRMIGILTDVASLAIQNATFHEKSLTMADQPFDKIEDPEVKKEKMYKIGKTYEENEMYDGAIEIYEAIMKIDPNYRDIPKKLNRLRDLLAIQMEYKNMNLSEGLNKKFKNFQKIGIGGMGIVYKALDLARNQTVAIKVIAEKYRNNQKTIRRFIKRDGLAAKRLDHPGIVKVFEVVEGDMPYIVMEYVEGESFRKILDRLGRIQPLYVKRIALQVGEALAYAHSNNIIHRDIKPDNIMLHQNRIIKIMDFGLAKILDVSSMTETGEVFGTLYYMPPEQLRGGEITEGTDIYALGVTLYEFLTGTLPFKGNNPEQVMYKIFNTLPPPPSKIVPELPPELDRIVMKAIEKEVDKRYQSAYELIDDCKVLKLKNII
ncbi:MAG: protein kinase [Candidatus Wallbacteria bacterium]|nr:protein kinase [Candidatus Wallbacteria bacterium]